MTAQSLTYCRICEAACGLVAERNEAGTVVSLRPDRDHPISRGFVCAKGTRFLEVAHHQSRLLQPQRRRADGQLEATTWRSALREIRRRLRPIVRRHGPHAVGIYAGNPGAFNVLGSLATLGLARALGTRNLFSASSQDCNNKFAGAELIHGTAVIHPIPDVRRAELVVLFGTNPAVSQSSFVHLPGGARALDELEQRGGRVVVVDPRRTESARRWDTHLAIRPGTDIFLMLALLDGLRDRARHDSRVEGLDRLLALAARYPVTRAAELTGLPLPAITDLLDALRATRRAALHMSVGVNQSRFGTLAYVALHALSYLAGALDSEGGSLFHPLAVQLGRFTNALDARQERARSRIGGFTSIITAMPGGVLADEIRTAGRDRIRALIVIAGDPLRSIPGGDGLRRAFERLDALVSVDLFENHTGRLADWILPSTSWLERWDVATTTLVLQTDGLLQSAGPVEPMPGQVRPDWRIAADLSRALGRPLMGSGLLTRLLTALPLERLGAAMARLAARRLDPERREYGLPTPRPKAGQYLGRGPLTPGHRLRLWSDQLEPEVGALEHWVAELTTPALDYQLIGRRRRIGHNSWLHRGVRGQPRDDGDCWMARADLEALGLVDGAAVRLASNGCALDVIVRGRDEIRPGTVVVPHGLPETNVNALIPSGPERLERLSGQHWMTGIPIRIEPLE